MAESKWYVKAREFANCNCAYGCPCQFNALPTHGYCCAAVGYAIDEGRFGETRLDGLLAAGLYTWPGPVHEGGGTMRLIIDRRANQAQREALVKIMSGEETQEMATHWWVYSAMCSTKLEPLYEPIELEIDIDKRRGKLVVPGIIDMTGEPIRNPVTGAEHRVRIDMPEGFEYRLAEVGSASTKATGPIELNLKDSYGQFAHLHLTGAGVVS